MNPNHHKRDGINLNNPAISCCGVRKKKKTHLVSTFFFFYDIVVACQFKFKLKVTMNAAAFTIISGSLGSKGGGSRLKKKKRRRTGTWCNLAGRVRVGTWTERCREWSNNTADKGEFLLAERMQSLQKFPVTSDPRRWWYSWEHDSNSLTWSRRPASEALEPARCSLCATSLL